MYRNILKKDIKRKKTMNIILLLFTILATVFVASGISNVINVVNGTEYFLDKAGIGDYVVITQDKNINVKNVSGQQGEYITDDNLMQTERERSLNNWLMDLGW